MTNQFLTNYTEITFLDKIKDNLRKCKAFSFSVSCIKKAGLVLLFKDIEAAVERGAKGRIITSTSIIEAAKTLYESHSVEDITRHEADKVSTDATIVYILDVIQKSKANREKSNCFVTGVPGAGKTLVGLDVAVRQTYQGQNKPIEDEGAVYLSGNGPLVAVLTEALAKDNYQKCRDRNESKKSDSRREVGKFIQIIHRYRDNMLAKISVHYVRNILPNKSKQP